jgi:hypothetical protein
MHMHAPASLAAQYDVRLGDACACLRSGSKACHNQVQYITASESWLATQTNVASLLDKADIQADSGPGPCQRRSRRSCTMQTRRSEALPETTCHPADQSVLAASTAASRPCLHPVFTLSAQSCLTTGMQTHA